MTESTKAPPFEEAAELAEAGPKLSGEIVSSYESMLASVPDAGEGSFERILQQIASATDKAALDAPWRSSGLEEYANVELAILSIAKMPSDFPGGLPWFLVIDAMIPATGEALTITTGAVSVVAQLVKAWALGAFPLRVVPIVAERASRSGYHPVHLQLVR